MAINPSASVSQAPQTSATSSAPAGGNHLPVTKKYLQGRVFGLVDQAQTPPAQRTASRQQTNTTQPPIHVISYDPQPLAVGAAAHPIPADNPTISTKARGLALVDLLTQVPNMTHFREPVDRAVAVDAALRSS